MFYFILNWTALTKFHLTKLSLESGYHTILMFIRKTKKIYNFYINFISVNFFAIATLLSDKPKNLYTKSILLKLYIFYTTKII